MRQIQLSEITSRILHLNEMPQPAGRLPGAGAAQPGWRLRAGGGPNPNAQLQLVQRVLADELTRIGGRHNPWELCLASVPRPVDQFQALDAPNRMEECQGAVSGRC